MRDADMYVTDGTDEWYKQIHRRFLEMWWTRRPKSYAGCHVCITGGSEGLGFALAKLFVEEDANVSIIARTAAKLDRAKAALQESGHSGNRVVAVTADCNEVESIHSAIRKAEEELGAVDVLIANAGTAVPGKFLDTKISDFESQMRLNYLGTVYTVKAVAASMVQRGQGEVIIISSALGVLGLTGREPRICGVVLMRLLRICRLRSNEMGSSWTGGLSENGIAPIRCDSPDRLSSKHANTRIRGRAQDDASRSTRHYGCLR